MACRSTLELDHGGPWRIFMMKPTKRKPVNKYKSAKNFRHAVSKTHPRNVQMKPHRGGWRL